MVYYIVNIPYNILSYNVCTLCTVYQGDPDAPTFSEFRVTLPNCDK